MVQPSPTSKQDLHRWVRAHLDQLEAAAPDLPVEDRAADTWEPLVAIADTAGGQWPTNARAAVLALTTDDVNVDTVSLRVRLLIDSAPPSATPNGLPSETLVARLREDTEAPWDTLGKNGLNPKSLAGLLHDFGIHSVQRPLGGRQPNPRLQTRPVRRLLAPLLPRPQFPSPLPSQPSHRPMSVNLGRQSTLLGRTSAVPNPPIRHKSTLMGRRDGWDGKAQATSAAVCISCRQPLSYDDGTHTHPTCNADKECKT